MFIVELKEFWTFTHWTCIVIKKNMVIKYIHQCLQKILGKSDHKSASQNAMLFSGWDFWNQSPPEALQHLLLRSATCTMLINFLNYKQTFVLDRTATFLVRFLASFEQPVCCWHKLWITWEMKVLIYVLIRIHLQFILTQFFCEYFDSLIMIFKPQWIQIMGYLLLVESY